MGLEQRRLPTTGLVLPLTSQRTSPDVKADTAASLRQWLIADASQVLTPCFSAQDQILRL